MTNEVTQEKELTGKISFLIIRSHEKLYSSVYRPPD